MARSAAMSAPMGMNYLATPESLQGFNLIPQMMAQMMAHFPCQHFINQVLTAHQGNTSNNPASRVEEDLAKPYKPSNLSCFSQQITDYDFQTRIKMPSHIRTYDGTEYPENHLQIFPGAARGEKKSNDECCLTFMQTLVGSARIWFNDLPERSIRTFDDLRKGFMANFSQQWRYVKDATMIFQIKQRDDESFRDFIERYKKKGLSYVGADEKMRVAGFMNAITSNTLQGTSISAYLKPLRRPSKGIKLTFKERKLLTSKSKGKGVLVGEATVPTGKEVTMVPMTNAQQVQTQEDLNAGTLQAGKRL
ncbi:uncharacterized protein LOC110893142 [Helianthus annuus]|uniref:uncharacterized protein LOC110893142 n=1 Tax=Helianthus annuus TaxID=4232 RepID=UPI000B901CD4|nr:uncharacterized protein LOC110893142 [Helianthus annuus]